MEALQANQLEEGLFPVDGGHMLYEKCIVVPEYGQPLFIKAHNKELFTNPDAAANTLSHLKREGEVYKALKEGGYYFLPDEVYYDKEESTLYLSAHLPEAGWCWELPKDSIVRERYVYDSFRALQQLETVPASLLPSTERQASLDQLYEQGWLKLQDSDIQTKVFERLEEYKDQFHPHVELGVSNLQKVITDNELTLRAVTKHLNRRRAVVGHFDARQSNIAWHPEHGAKIVDWSWASPTVAGADRTMFTIDLFKSGYDISSLITYNFDPEHALLQIGHWAVRSTLPASVGDSSVRFHQLASAVSAATLL